MNIPNPVHQALQGQAQAPSANMSPMALGPMPAPRAPAPSGIAQPQAQRVLSPQDLQHREAVRQQMQGGQPQQASQQAPMQPMQPAQTQQAYGQPTPQQWQQFMQYMQQLQGQQQPYQQQAPYPQQGYQQRMQAYGQPNYNMPRLGPQQPPPGAMQGANMVERPLAPGTTVGANMVERPAAMTVRQPPTMSPAQTSMPVQSPAVAPAMAPETMSRPVSAGPMIANPVHQAIGNPALAMSDRTQKVLEQRTLADDFLDHLKAYTYKYKDPGMEPRVHPTGGTYLGVMAQDLEKVPHVGPQIVVETPHGKMVDQKTALSATMAGLARLNERLRAVEKDSVKKKGKK